MSSLPPDSVLNRFTPLAVVGAGPLGDVYAATERATGRTVALQVCQRPRDMPPERWQQAVALSIRELIAAQSLEHPNIARIYEFGDEGDLLYLITEWDDAETLGMKLRREQRPGFDEATRQIIRAGFAVQYAANNGVRHGNLTPHSLILSGGTVRVAGFGLAHWRPGDRSIYRAPEEIEGDPGDLQADLFVLGLIWCELVGGRHPFAAETAEQTREQIVTAPTPSPANVPFYLQPVVRKLLAKIPTERYSSWPEVALDVSGARPLPAAPAPVPERVETPGAPVEEEDAPALGLTEEARRRIAEAQRRRQEEDRRPAPQLGFIPMRMRGLRLAAAAVPATCLVASLAHRATENSLQLNKVHGEVTVASAAAPAGTRARSGYHPRADDRIETGPGGSAQLRIGDGSRLLLEEKTSLRVSEVRFRSRTSTRARVFLASRGEIFCRVAHRPRLVFVVDTPNGSVRVTGTEFAVEVDSQGRTQVTTLDGRVDTGKPPTPVRPGQRATLVDNRATVVNLAPSELSRYQRKIRRLKDDGMGDTIAGFFQALDDATLTPLGDLVHGAAGGAMSGFDTMKEGGIRAQAIFAMQTLHYALEQNEGGPPSTLDPETLAEIRPGAEMRKKILGEFRGNRLEFYHRLPNGYEVGARMKDEAGTMVILRNGRTTVGETPQ